MEQLHYNGSTQKKKIIVTPFYDMYHMIKVVYQEWDSPEYGYVTRKIWRTKELIISKKAKAYSNTCFEEKKEEYVLTTEYYIKSGIKIEKRGGATLSTIYVKQVSED